MLDPIVAGELREMSAGELLYRARALGYSVRTVDVPSAKTFGQFRIGGNRVEEDGPDIWMNAVNVLLYEKQTPG